MQPLGRTGEVRGCCWATEQLDASHLCAGVQNNPVLNSKRDQPWVQSWALVSKIQTHTELLWCNKIFGAQPCPQLTLCKPASFSVVLHYPKCPSATFRERSWTSCSDLLCTQKCFSCVLVSYYTPVSLEYITLEKRQSQFLLESSKISWALLAVLLFS